MPSTSVYFPEDLLGEMDRLAEERGISRNGLIVESCRDALRTRREWPAQLRSNDHLSVRDLAELRAGAKDLEAAIMASRQSRRTAPF
jgi:metal-responsive CopG/Arc/MetJ family transcriptional regulator